MGLSTQGLSAPGGVQYSVLSFAAVSEVFTRKDDFCSESYIDIGVSHKLGDSILNMDGRRHRSLRDVIQPHFQPANAEGWWNEIVIGPLVKEFIDKFADQPGVDLNAHFFARLPMHTVTTGFGMSPQQGLEFRGHMLRAFDYTRTPAEVTEATNAAGELLAGVIADRRLEPRDDLISKLAHANARGSGAIVSAAHSRGDRLLLPPDRLRRRRDHLRQLGIATFALMTHPEQMEDVRRDRSLLPNAILESTRWNPDRLFYRQVIRDTVLQGVELPKGALLNVCTGAANRDPTRREDPDRFDIHPPNQRSTAFAAGAHSCLGQHVARQEIASAINGLLDRFPNLRWDPAYPPAKLTGSLVARGPGPMHVLLPY